MRNSLDIIFFFTGILSSISKSLEWSALSASPLCASDFSLPDGALLLFPVLFSF
jgi:hypothetical protein